MEGIHLIYEFALVLGIVITSIILLLLVKKKQKLVHQQILITFFTIIFFLFVYYYSVYHRLYGLFVIANLLTEGIGFILGPLIYYYVKSLLSKINFLTPKVFIYMKHRL